MQWGLLGGLDTERKGSVTVTGRTETWDRNMGDGREKWAW